MYHYDGYILHLHIVTSFINKKDEDDNDMMMRSFGLTSDEKCIYKSYTLSQLTRWLNFSLEFTKTLS